MKAIRLKEMPRGAVLYNTPPDWYISSRPSLEQRPYRMETDAFGFVKSSAGPDSDTRIVVLGDSFVEGMFLDPEARFCSALEARLRRQHQLDISVLNGGYSGATTLHSLNVFLNKVIPMKPLAVVLMTGIIDIDAATKRASFWSTDCRLEPVIDTEVGNGHYDSDLRPTHDFVDRERMLTIFVEAARQFDVPLWFATVPHRQVYRGDYVAQSFADRVAFERDVEPRRLTNEVTRRVALRHRLPLFDIERNLASRDDISYDMFHLNAAGGEAVADCFVNLGFVDAIRYLLGRQGADLKTLVLAGNGG
jgi:hypothetical protein